MEVRPSPSPRRPALVQAEPEPIEIDLAQTAIVVVDMQNGFVKRGGFFDLMGAYNPKGEMVIEPVKKLCDTARANNIKVIYVGQTCSPDFHEAGNPSLPFYYKGGFLRLYREHPEWADKLMIRGAWGAEIIEELKPQKGDIFIEKPRYSAFFSTTLDMTLRSLDIKYLAVTGVATNICVEASIRDAFYHNYFALLVKDGTAQFGPDYIKEATIFNVKACYGWVTNTETLISAMK